MSEKSFKTRLYVLNTGNIDEEDFDILYKNASIERQMKADRVKFFQDKLRSICGYHILRLVYITIKEERPDLFKTGDNLLPEICYGEKGKPYLKDCPLQFNISHSGERVIIAISLREVGCDVECKKNDNLSIANRFFAPEEYEYLKGANDFTSLWTVKESVIKACGEGMSYSMKDFCVVKSGKVADSIVLSCDGQRYYIKRYNSDGKYELSVCGLSGEFEDNYRMITYDKKQRRMVVE